MVAALAGNPRGRKVRRGSKGETPWPNGVGGVLKLHVGDGGCVGPGETPWPWLGLAANAMCFLTGAGLLPLPGVQRVRPETRGFGIVLGLPRRSKQPLVPQNHRDLRVQTPPYEGATPAYEGPGASG